MPDGDVAGVVLAAGRGTRLRPLTWRRPKPLCPLADRTLLDHNVDRARGAVADVAVNACHGVAQISSHVGAMATPPHLSIEQVALGTAGAVARLRPWLDGRNALIVNGDTWSDISLTEFVAGWDGREPSVLVLGEPPLHARSRVVASLLPAAEIGGLAEEPSGLWETVWRDALGSGRLATVGCEGRFVDCGTPADYVRANLETCRDDPMNGIFGEVRSGGHVFDSVVGAGAVVEGEVLRSVIGPGVVVASGERIIDGVRLDQMSTVLIR